MHNIFKWAAVGTASALLLSGCGLIYKPTGHVLNHYTLDEAVPYSLASGDLNKTTCGTGLALSQLMGSFSRVINRPARTLLSTNTLAAMCSESQAQDAHLLVLRNLHNGNVDAARDNRIIAQRWERITALRRYQVFKDTERAYGDLGGQGCPDLTNEMGTELDKLQFLVGTLTSVQGVLSDIQANSTVGIPQDIAARAGRASQCLDNQQWWGVPDALEAIVWLSVPGNAPEGADPWAQLERSAAIGERQGMALAPMLYALAAYGQSDTAREKVGIERVARTYNSDTRPSEFQILNEVAYSQAQYLSDRLWMADSGHRTPLLALGTFPGDSDNSESDFNAEDFL
ncbi:hypothetical protein [Salinisphaera sp. T31B1]|uniref:hypothetical protein n=1 Tax=Salinisphaera sp. T31B1 TaxID=727963 RepID=UPI00333F50D3